MPVVDIRGDDLSETEEESDEYFLSFETEDNTSGFDYDIYDFTSAYDTNSWWQDCVIRTGEVIDVIDQKCHLQFQNLKSLHHQTLLQSRKDRPLECQQREF